MGQIDRVGRFSTGRLWGFLLMLLTGIASATCESAGPLGQPATVTEPEIQCADRGEIREVLRTVERFIQLSAGDGLGASDEEERARVAHHRAENGLKALDRLARVTIRE